jgi:hypothetical protein
MQHEFIRCPLCGNGPIQVDRNLTTRLDEVRCGLCGVHSKSSDVPDDCKKVYGDQTWKLASYVKEKSIRGLPIVFFPSQEKIPPDAPSGSVGLDEAIKMFPTTVADRLDRALMNLAAVTKHLGQRIVIDAEMNPLLLAQNSLETLFVIEQFAHDGYLKGRTTSLPTEVSLTSGGLSRAAELQRGLFGPLNKQVFVAMSFDKSLDSAWTDGLKMGIEDCGYDALRVDRKQHNEKICDVIIAEIRKSKFLVADFTLHRNGVYFEAGMMMGLGRPVIFTCRKDDLVNAHFDTRQYNHIDWEKPSELREKLRSRIQATIPL